MSHAGPVVAIVSLWNVTTNFTSSESLNKQCGGRHYLCTSTERKQEGSASLCVKKKCLHSSCYHKESRNRWLYVCTSYLSHISKPSSSFSQRTYVRHSTYVYTVQQTDQPMHCPCTLGGLKYFKGGSKYYHEIWTMCLITIVGENSMWQFISDLVLAKSVAVGKNFYRQTLASFPDPCPASCRLQYNK